MKAVININSGLGNQMFQYAFGRALHAMNPQLDLLFDLSWFEAKSLHSGFELEHIFKLELPRASKHVVENLGFYGYTCASRLCRRLLVKTSEVREAKADQFRYNLRYLKLKKNDALYTGYWQCFEYISLIENLFPIIFSFPKIDSSSYHNLKLIEEIIRAGQRSVSIHVRRGDYQSHTDLRGICGASYYTRSIDYIYSIVTDPVFFVFSDEPEWARANLDIGHGFFVDWNVGNDSYRDMQLMSLCAHNIIANSTFSWWGALLNRSDRKVVICPTNWTRYKSSADVSPATWKRL